MTVGQVSSFATRDALRQAIGRTQRSVDVASKEVASGRHFDMGLALGVTTSKALDMRGISSELATIAKTNDLATERLTQMQAALSSIADIADGLFKSAVTAQQSGGDRSQFVADAKARLASLTSLLSTTSNGAYVFSGTNTGVQPLGDYLRDPPNAARSAVVAAFTSHFGFAPNDPQASSITPSQFDAYMDGPYAALFQDPQWGVAFSEANDAPVRIRISLNDVVETTTSANSAGVRNLMSALVAVIDAGAGKLDGAAYQALAGRVAKAAAGVSSQIVSMQSDVGAVQERLTKASDRIVVQQGALDKGVAALEGVDSLEASTRLNSLTTKLEVSYAVTARLQHLSLLNYL